MGGQRGELAEKARKSSRRSKGKEIIPLARNHPEGGISRTGTRHTGHPSRRRGKEEKRARPGTGARGGVVKEGESRKARN